MATNENKNNLEAVSDTLMEAIGRSTFIIFQDKKSISNVTTVMRPDLTCLSYADKRDRVCNSESSRLYVLPGVWGKMGLTNAF